MQALERAALRPGRRTQRGAANSREASDAEGEAGSIKGGRATIGVQQPSSDPHIETFDEADLPALAQWVAAVPDRVRSEPDGRRLPRKTRLRAPPFPRQSPLRR